jgi:hypothetical protein
MLKIGEYNDLIVERKVDFGYYLNSGDDEVLLPTKYVPEGIELQDTLNVFVYTDSEDRPVATILTPKGIVGDFVFMEVKDTTPIGAFLDWGLEKDLLVPNNEQKTPMKKGAKYVVKICFDAHTERVYATAHIQGNCDKDTSELKEGDQADLLIYAATDIGIMAVVNNRYSGMLYKSETFMELAPGDSLKGYISKIREDGKIDLILKKPGYKSVEDSTEKILSSLRRAGGFMPFNDKSSPEDIKTHFSMSKKEFKKVIGALYKKKMILLQDNGIQVIADS